MGKSSALRRAKLKIAALSILAATTYPGTDTFNWNMPNDLSKETPHHGYYSKGHSRANWEQKKIAFNHRKAKRRAKNKVAKKARQAQRRK